MALTRKHVAGAGIGGAVAIAAVLGYSFEGERHRVYLDSVRVPTYCIGETLKPDWNHVYTHKECMDIYEGRLEFFVTETRACIKGDVSDNRLAAFSDLSYNIGVGGFCHSSVVRLQNTGHYTEACDAMRAFNHAGGHVLAGLTRRREAERQLCLKD